MNFIKKLTFRKKLFFTQLGLFVLFITLLYPLIGKSVHQIIRSSLEETSNDLIDTLKKAKTEEEMVNVLKSETSLAFFRITLFNAKEQILFDSHSVQHPGEQFIPLLPEDYPEVKVALKTGSVGYAEQYSPIFKQKLVYVATVFYANGEKFVVRTSFPYDQVEGLTQNFQIGFLLVGGTILLFFSLMTWLIFFRMSVPIQNIINAVKPYQKAAIETLPLIPIKEDEDEEINQLARTLNALSARVRSQLLDITEERNEKEAILESLGEGVIAVDADKAISYVNQTGSKMLSIPKKELLKKKFPSQFEGVSYLLLSKCKTLLEKCQKAEKVLIDTISIDDKLFLDLIAAPKTKGRGAIIVIQDKSSQHKVVEMGKSFIANASHELRTPITIIRGFAETLQDMPDLPREMISDMVEKIVRNCQRMESLVKNLLTLADIENIPETHFQPTDLVSILENCRHLLLSVHPSIYVGIVKGQDKISIPADGDLLELAILNLLENAVKYSKPPAHITVSIEELEDKVKIAISDRGIGIPSEDIDNIFERFYTVDKAHSRRLGGAGLGLSIVKTIIQKHNGTIKASSNQDVGTTFTILLPTVRA